MFSLRAWAVYLLLALLAACTTAPALPAQTGPHAVASQPPARAVESTPTYAMPTIRAPLPLPSRPPGAPALTPTPDAPRVLPTMRAEPTTYVVQPSDYLSAIARSQGVSVNDLIEANGIENPDLLEVGQVLAVPAPKPRAAGPGFKILPDSELVYGPLSGYFDLAAYVAQQPGYLAHFYEEVDDQSLSGAQVVEKVAQQYSVNPRLLLALLEYRSGWLTAAHPPEDSIAYPAGYPDPARPGLYRQLAWAANNLNRGYYLWRVNAIASYLLVDGSYIVPDARINAGTAAVQYLLSQFFGFDEWRAAAGADGFFAVYTKLFGNPFDLTIEPLVPPDTQQPVFQLPFEDRQTWSFTGGPHGGWGDGSAWAALDFAPPGEALGCVPNNAWVTAVADGVILRAGNGEVIQDLDGDGLEQTGWLVLYMHVESRDRVQPGAFVQAGDRIGHPSCEGGVSSGTHLHLARRYNGEWIPTDGDIPFNLDGWTSAGFGSEYDGVLERDGQSIEAWVGRRPENQIQR